MDVREEQRRDEMTIGSEVRRLLRSVAWWVLLGVSAVVLLVVVPIVSSVFTVFTHSGGAGEGIYSTVVYAVLSLVIAITPAMAARAAIGVRQTPTAPRTGREAFRAIWTGLLVAWIAALGVVVVGLPFLVVTAIAGSVPGDVVAVSLLMLLLETLLVTAIAYGAAILVTRRGVARLLAYASVAVLVLGTQLLFWGVGNTGRIDTTVASRGVSTSVEDEYGNCDIALDEGASDCESDGDGYYTSCEAWSTVVESRPRLDYAWWVLAMNPYVTVADAVPLVLDESGSTAGLFGTTSMAVRMAQEAGTGEVTLDSCTVGGRTTASDTQDLLDRTASSWGAGLLVQGLLAAGLLAWGSLRLPIRP